MILKCYVICENPDKKGNGSDIGFSKKDKMQDVLMKIGIELGVVESYKETVIDYNGVNVKGVYLITAVSGYPIVADFETFDAIYTKFLTEGDEEIKSVEMYLEPEAWKN